MRSSRNFTMFELLAVLVIVFIIMAMMVPAFNKLTSGMGVDTAGRTVVAKLRLARQYAITQRTRVAVIMPRAEGGKMMSQYQYSCVRIALVTGTGSPYTFDKWMDNSKWSFLPPGTAIMEADVDEGVANGVDAWQKDPAENGGQAVDDVNLSKIETGSAGLVDGVRAIVFLPTGKMSGGAPGRYVTIGEAVFTGGSWVINNQDTNVSTKNQSCMNQVSIECDYYTGRAIYRTPEEY